MATGTTSNMTDVGTEQPDNDPEPEPEPQPEPEPVPPKKEEEPESEDVPDFEMWKNIDLNSISFNQLVKNIWTFLSQYTPQKHNPDTEEMPLWKLELITVILEKGLEALQAEPLVLEIKGECTVFGPLYGQGDSLTALISTIGMVPEKQFLFLGGYIGMGFAPIETFLMILALKHMFPKRVWMLRGHQEQPFVLDQLFITDMLYFRNIKKWDDQTKIYQLMVQIFAELPLVAILEHNIWAMCGGPGETMLNPKMPKINEITKANREKRPMNEVMVMFEAMWSCFRFNKDGPNVDKSMPTFNEAQAKDWMNRMGIKILIRGRQLVQLGALEHPVGVFTVSSAGCYLDQFGNMAAAITVKGRKMWIHRIRMKELEPKSDDLAKAGIGRNWLY